MKAAASHLDHPPEARKSAAAARSLMMNILNNLGGFARWCVLACLSVVLAACGGGGDTSTAPSITTQPASLTVVVGQPAVFTVAASGSPAPTFQWRKNGIDLPGATSASYSVAATAAGDNGALFSVVVSNSAGSVTSSAATLTVGPPPAPVIVTQPSDVSVVVGSTAVFSVLATGADPITYQWRKNGTPIVGATAASYTTPVMALADAGAVYSVAVNNPGGTATSRDALLTVTVGPSAPTITTSPASQTVTEPATARFTVAAGGTAPLAYQWRRNGVDIVGATAASYTTAATTRAGDDGARFSVIVSNGMLPNAVSGDATLTVLAVTPVMPRIDTQPSSVSARVGATASFSVTASGSATLTYQWTKNGADISGAITAAYTTPAIVAADNGALFAVRVANGAGTVTSNAATLSVTGVAPSIVTAPTAQTVTAPSPATFTVVASGSAPLAYQWRRNNVVIAGATSASYTTAATSVAADNGARYSVVVSNGTAPNATSAQVVLTVVPTPVAPTIANVLADTTVIVGQTATFSVTATGTAPLAYQWRRNGVAIVGATSASYTTATTVAGDDGAHFSVVVSNGTAPDATSREALLTVQTVWTGIRQDGARVPGETAVQLSYDGARAVTTDAAGNVIIAGYTTGIFATPPVNAYTPFVAKYSPAGALLWARTLLDTRNGFGVPDVAKGVAVDAAGNIYVIGETLTGLTGELAAGNVDVFILKLDPDGNRLWAHQFGSSAYDHANGIAVDSQGSAFIVGWSAGQLPGQLPPFGEDYFIAKYDTSGNRVWMHQGEFTPADPHNDEAAAVAVDASGNAYVAGMRAGEGGNAPMERIYVVKYDTGGNLVWTGNLQAHSASNPAYQLPMRSDGIAVSADGTAVYVSGWTYADFDGVDNPAVAPNCCVQGDAFVARLNGQGVVQWAHNLSSMTLSGPRYFDDEAFAIATNSAGSAVFIAGYTNGVMPGNTSKVGEDMFAARYEADGTRTWIQQLGSGLPAAGTQNDRAYGIAIDLHGDLFVTGETLGTFGTPGQNTDRNDWFVLKLKPTDGSRY